jgi:uncharacterized protein (DUF1015 family)
MCIMDVPIGVHEINKRDRGLLMAEFKPFTGIRYDTGFAGPLEELVAPPYDVINASEVDELQNKSDYNITHLTRPTGDLPYDVADRFFSQWKASGALKTDSHPTFYVYRQKFNDPDTGEEFPERVGVIGLLKVEDFSTGKVLPHENTLTAARVDRLNLLRKTLANFESIYGLYSDPDGVVDYVVNGPKYQRKVVGEVADAIGSSHVLEAITDPAALAAITEYFEEVPIFIADGHHRYETSLGFSKERPDLPKAQYILITLTALEDEGLLVLPTHRLLVNFSNEEILRLPAHLARAGFTVTPNIHKDTEIKPLHFILVTPVGEYYFGLPHSSQIEKLVPTEQSLAWKSLDVSVLHTLVVDKILGVPLDKLSTTEKVAYTRDAAEARRQVATGVAQAAVIMGRPTVDQMKAVSEAGDKMPQKSTFFYPKLLSGLVLYDIS